MLWTNSGKRATLEIMTVKMSLAHPWEMTEKPIHWRCLGWF